MTAVNKPILVDLNNDPEAFFDLLPDDWRAELLSLWPNYADSSSVLGLQLDNKLIGGGIVFRQPAPDTLGYVDLAQSLFDKGLLYIGHLWIVPAHRGHDYGGVWLQAVRRRFAGEGFWLAIEDSGLRRFYEQHGFVVGNTLRMDGSTEWIMTDSASKPL